MTKFTPEQQSAIESAGQSLRVSAAAGSGKTSVLAEKCAYLICDAPKPFRCDVTDLLVVTFTEAAAAEMRSRIADALHKRYQQSAEPRLGEQLALIDRAQISTIHSFCSRVIRQHFHLLGIDPNFQMLGEDEGKLLRSEIARDLFAARYETDESGDFQRLIDQYGDGNEESLRYRVIQTHALLGSLARPDIWQKSARARIDRAAKLPLKDSTLGKVLLKTIGRHLATIHARLVQVLTQLQSFKRLDKYQDFASELLAHAEDWNDAFNKSGVDGLAARVKEFSLDRFPAITKLTPAEESIKAELVDIRDAMKCGEIFNLCRFSEKEWRDGMSATLVPANLLLDLVEDFTARYRDAKKELRVLDFVDLEQMALAVLGEKTTDNCFAPTAAALAYREQFAHVLVDEYQDVNELQDTILSLVSREGEQNFFCVGDVKQSIYRFRLADPKRFLERLRPKENRTVIHLQTNFRSRSQVLDALNGIFARLMTFESAELVYDESHALRAPENSPYLAQEQTDPHVELHLLPKQIRGEGDESHGETDADSDLDQSEREASFIATRIRELLKTTRVLAKSSSGEMESRALKLGDIAILLRSMHFKADRFADMLRRAGIPAHHDSGGGFFESTEVQDILALLKVLDNRRQDIPLAALLRSPLAGIPNREDALAKIRLAYPGSATEMPFHQAIARYANEQKNELAAHLRDFFAKLDDWRQRASRRPLAEVLWRIYDQTGYLAFCEGLDDGAQRVANLLALHERSMQFSSFKKQGVGRFMRFLDQLRDEVDDLGQPSTASQADDAVRIMSVHRSKGLEFPIVFVPDLGKRHNLSDCAGHILLDREAGIGMSVCDEARRIRYPSLASTIVSERLKKQMLAEELRVLYVATTRAREKLILVGTCGTDASEKWTRKWSNHAGAIPADEVLRGGCMLDWIGPALTAMKQDPALAQRFSVTLHESAPAEMSVARAPAGMSARLESLARLDVIGESIPAESRAEAERVWKRLTQTYPFEPFKKVPASMSVTSLAKQSADEIPRRENEEDFIRVAEPLRSARSVSPQTALTGADIGAATHLLIQHLDISRPCDENDLRTQTDALIDRQLLSENICRAIDLSSIAWFMNHDLGRLLREHRSSVLRELPINFPHIPDLKEDETPSNDPMDRVMARGRIDLLLALPERAIVVDFKTDRIDGGEEFDLRVEKYRSQIAQYRDAIKELLNVPICETHLVFLARQRIITA